MNDDLKPTNSKKLSDSVAELIKEDIISKSLPPGERLFDEKDFLKNYKVSKGTMREALKSLEVQGLVNIRTGPGGGASVSRVSSEKTNELLWNYFFHRNISLEDIYALRKIIEPELAASVTGRLDDEDLELLEASVEHCSEDHPQGSQREQRFYELDFHHVLADACPNPILSFFAKFILSLLARLFIQEQLNPDPELSKKHQINGVNYHQKLMQALRDDSPEKVRQLMTEHMESAEIFALNCIVRKNR
jgi:DNA-binding FadR family transcriptional regulator|tara:strand:+ start:7231 stop:7974 length:744 start_codon:yes stop_codon:yes gene_type:complete